MNKKNYMLNGFSMEEIRNRNEERAIKILEEVIVKSPDFDGCQLCTEDVYGLTINQLPTRYVQVGGLNLSKKKISDDEIRVIAEEAVQMIVKKPSHETS